MPAESRDDAGEGVCEAVELTSGHASKESLSQRFVIPPQLVGECLIHYAERPEPLHGRETWQPGFELVRRAFPHLETATGRTIEYVSHEFYRVQEGLIAEEWICSDMASLFRQLG